MICLSVNFFQIMQSFYLEQKIEDITPLVQYNFECNQ